MVNDTHNFMWYSFVMERVEREICLGEESDGESRDNESSEDDGEFCYASVPASKLQPR